MKNLLLVLCAAFMLAGCERAMQNMYDQPRYKPRAAAPDLPGGSSRGRCLLTASSTRAETLPATSSGAVGKGDAQAGRARHDRAVDAVPGHDATLHRGRDRYAIYCAPATARSATVTA